MSDRKTEILEALKNLSTEEESHWTMEGMPRLDARPLVNLNITRKELNTIAPDFSRTTPTLPEEPKTEPVPETSVEEATFDNDTPSELEKIEQQLGELYTLQDSLNQDIDALRKRAVELTEKINVLTAKRTELSPKMNHAEMIRVYQESQRKLRERRMLGVAQLEQLAGGKLPAILGQAPIDGVRKNAARTGNTVKKYPIMG